LAAIGHFIFPNVRDVLPLTDAKGSIAELANNHARGDTDMFKILSSHTVSALLLISGVMPLQGHAGNAVTQAMAAHGGDQADARFLPSAELEARHFDIYKQYHAVFERPQPGAQDADAEQPALRRALLTPDQAPSLSCSPAALPFDD
jgi:hypothetical protein